MDFTTNEGVILAVEGAGAKELGANTRFPLDSVFGQFDALKHGEIHRVDDVAAISMPSELQVLVEKGIRSYINIPLVVQGELLGTLNIGADVTEAFTAEDMNIAWEIADSLAIAIQQARLYQQVQKHAQDLEQRVAERTAELTTTNKELERFGYSVSHDLRAPLRGINGFSMALIEDYGAILDEEGRDYLKRIRAATLRMGQLIDDLLNLARVTRTEMVRQTIDLSAIARSIADNFQKEQPDRRVEVHIQEGAVIHGDVLLMTVVLQNLLDNAWKFTSKHKHAHIEFGFRDEANERVIYVRDDGAGFDMAYKDKLFYPFERLHTPQEFEGSGVGLATVRRIIERHGGRVWAEGEIDKGATVWFSVPIQKH